MSASIEIRSVPHPAPTPADVRAKLIADPGFGKIFSDHMVTVRWSSEKAGMMRNCARGRPFTLDPAAAVLHYAQESSKA
ncbi:hypothetical protein [Niveispirillum cyanobacteriorum]|uniref:hypothetical protein n=1 Tax=Niveispirillum cyanobacteriorum TaxID=1612173 RepID=UPI0026A02D07